MNNNNTIEILDLEPKEASKAFLESKNYFTCNLPEYFDFSRVLKEVDTQLRKKNEERATLSEIIPEKQFKDKLQESYNVNINLYLNKNGEYAWRKIQIINPWLYVSLVHLITEKDNWKEIQKRFADLDDKCGSNIICTSMPFIKKDGSSVKGRDEGINWWEKFEQENLKMALQYKYCVQTDIENCYESIYTHTIAWALNGKPTAKKNKRDQNLLGNKIDKAIRNMQNGQTNGLPQGSKIFDLIAELILRYSDSKLVEILNEKISNENYKILRYRDDYRIFSNSKETLDLIVKELSFISADLNLHFNNAKTHSSADIISSSIKPDKMYWLSYEPLMKSHKLSNQKKLLLIYKLSLKYPNSGSVRKALIEFQKLLSKRFKAIINYVTYVITFNIIKANDPLTEVEKIIKEPVNLGDSETKTQNLDRLCKVINSHLNQNIDANDMKNLQNYINKNENSDKKLATKIIKELSKGNIEPIKVILKNNFHNITGISNFINSYCSESESIDETIIEKNENLMNKDQSDYHQLAAILAMIGIRSPRQIDAVVGCLSVLYNNLNNKRYKQAFIDDMWAFEKRLEDIPNSEYMLLWMQRFFLGNATINFSNKNDNKLLNMISHVKSECSYSNLWNMEWLDSVEKIDNKLIAKSILTGQYSYELTKSTDDTLNETTKNTDDDVPNETAKNADDDTSNETTKNTDDDMTNGTIENIDNQKITKTLKIQAFNKADIIVDEKILNNVGPIIEIDNNIEY